jgi:hypothetical protein
MRIADTDEHMLALHERLEVCVRVLAVVCRY